MIYVCNNYNTSNVINNIYTVTVTSGNANDGMSKIDVLFVLLSGGGLGADSKG